MLVLIPRFTVHLGIKTHKDLGSVQPVSGFHLLQVPTDVKIKFYVDGGDTENK